MPRIARKLLPADGIFHVTTRGAGPIAVFRDDADRQSFVDGLHDAARRHAVVIHAWCLMGTHYHALIEGRRDQLSAAMRRANGLHARAMNDRWNRTGHLWGERFAAWVVRDEWHYVNTLAYIRDNPVKVGLCCDPSEWPWAGPRRTLLLADPPKETQHALAPGHAVCRACAAEAATVVAIPVVGGAERLGVGQPRLPTEQVAGLVHGHERILVRGAVVPLRER